MTSNKKSTIGIDVTAALTQGGGIGRYVRELIWAVGLADKERNYKLFFAKMSNPPNPLPLPKGDHIQHIMAPVEDKWLYRMWYRFKLPVSVQWFTGGLDLFHSPDFVLPPIYGDVPTLLTIHDLSFVHYPEVYKPELLSYLNEVVPWSVKRTTHIVADSEATKRDLIGIWGVDPAKITVLYSGIQKLFRPVTQPETQKRMRMKYKLPADVPYLLTVGTIQPRKNYRLLIKAFAKIAKNHPHHLAIAGGKGWLYDEIFDEVTYQGLTGRVHFVGFVDDIDLPTLYSGADLFLFPSLYEGFGLPILEAMGCGVPVISSNSSSLPEVAGKAAVLLDPNDLNGWVEAIDNLLSDPVWWEALRIGGYKQIEKFSWERSAKQLLTVYDGLLEK